MVLDFGCARGYVVRAFRELGYSAYGYDTSEWATENADLRAYHYLTRREDMALPVGEPTYDWVIAKDVLEHVERVEETITRIMGTARVGVFVVVPLSHDGKQYDIKEYEEDVTHIHRRPLQWWVGQFHRIGWSVDGRYRVPGIKDNYRNHQMGNGFVTARRIEE
jgi:SAM-dependent methyltransferase